MSRIYFHTLSDDDAELRGSERAWCDFMSAQVGLVPLDLDGINNDRLFSSISAGYPITNARMAETALRVGSASFVVRSGKYSAWEVLLNTCLAMGNDVLCFMARLHAQCELHAWVDGPHRAWLAGLIEAGRASGLMRGDQGWESVVALLRVRADEPAVTSYSVCEQFPNPGIAAWTPPDGDPDAWYDMLYEDRWALAMAGVRARALELTPDRLRAPFGHCKTAFDIMTEIATERAS